MTDCLIGMQSNSSFLMALKVSLLWKTQAIHSPPAIIFKVLVGDTLRRHGYAQLSWYLSIIFVERHLEETRLHHTFMGSIEISHRNMV